MGRGKQKDNHLRNALDRNHRLLVRVSELEDDAEAKDAKIAELEAALGCQASSGIKGETVSAPAEPLQADLVAEASENHQWQPEVKWKPMDDEILAKLTWLTEQGVEWGSTGAQTDEEHVEQFRKTLQETHAHFNTTEPRELHGVYLKGTETVICHTGTSPNSPMFARIITGLIMSALRIHNNLAKAANSQTQIEEPANAGDEVTDE